MEILRKETYIKMIENSVGTKLFNSIIIKNETGEVQDLLNDGEYSCALFVSSVLVLHLLLPRARTTVANLEKELTDHKSFIEVPKESIETGDVIFWESVTYEDGSQNRHVGFAISSHEAISTNYIEKCVVRHATDKEIENTGKIRKIEKVFRPLFE